MDAVEPQFIASDECIQGILNAINCVFTDHGIKMQSIASRRMLFKQHPTLPYSRFQQASALLYQTHNFVGNGQAGGSGGAGGVEHVHRAVIALDHEIIY